MALDSVVEEILAQAEKESRAIISEGEKEAKGILENARKRVKEETRAFDDETDMLVEEAERTGLSSLNTILKRQILEAKEHVVEELYSQVMQRVSELEGAERGKLIETMLAKAREELGSIGSVHCSERDKDIVSKKGFKTNVAKIDGIIAENKDGSVRANYTFEVLAKRLKEETLDEVAKKIFKD